MPIASSDVEHGNRNGEPRVSAFNFFALMPGGDLTMKLSTTTRKLKADILREYDFSDSAKLAILNTGLEAFEMMQKAIKLVETEGYTTKGDRGNIKAHPLMAVIRDCRSQFLGAMKQLKLDIDEEAAATAPGRPTAYDRYKKTGGL